MAVMASWNGKTWGVSSQRIAALNGISHSVELDTENSDDKAGSPATKTKALKLQSMSFDFDLAAAVGCDVRSEYESWTALVGQYAPFYLAGRRFGPANLHTPPPARAISASSRPAAAARRHFSPQTAPTSCGT